MTSDIRAAATAVITRDSDVGLEILLLRRHKQLKVGGGHWVFPGGTLDPEDYDGAGNEEQAARVAAARETMEEASISLRAQDLLLLSHWTTPPAMGRRFATWFFLAEGDNAEVLVDGEEMDDFLWGALFTATSPWRVGPFAAHRGNAGRACCLCDPARCQAVLS
jgi:8-oxo-dGTP pyrophosphatase MutT (NUDIX family)